MSHKTLSSYFLPHQISIERDYQKGIFSFSRAFLWELIKKYSVTTHFYEGIFSALTATKSVNYDKWQKFSPNKARSSYLHRHFPMFFLRRWMNSLISIESFHGIITVNKN
jgi:hypothetical protein